MIVTVNVCKIRDAVLCRYPAFLSRDVMKNTRVLISEYYWSTDLCSRSCKMSKIDIGIKQADRESIARTLKHLLADTYTLYLQTHNFHWNVEGPLFRDLHLMFEEQYTEMAEAVDVIAERIRTLDVYAPGTYKEFAELSSIKEVDGVPEGTDMVDILRRGHEQVVKTCRDVLEQAQKGDDESTIALASDRMRVHEKAAWMLRALNR